MILIIITILIVVVIRLCCKSSFCNKSKQNVGEDNESEHLFSEDALSTQGVNLSTQAGVVSEV